MKISGNGPKYNPNPTNNRGCDSKYSPNNLNTILDQKYGENPGDTISFKANSQKVDLANDNLSKIYHKMGMNAETKGNPFTKIIAQLRKEPSGSQLPTEVADKMRTMEILEGVFNKRAASGIKRIGRLVTNCLGCTTSSAEIAAENYQFAGNYLAQMLRGVNLSQPNELLQLQQFLGRLGLAGLNLSLIQNQKMGDPEAIAQLGNSFGQVLSNYARRKDSSAILANLNALPEEGSSLSPGNSGLFTPSQLGLEPFSDFGSNASSQSVRKKSPLTQQNLDLLNLQNTSSSGQGVGSSSGSTTLSRLREYVDPWTEGTPSSAGVSSTSESSSFQSDSAENPSLDQTERSNSSTSEFSLYPSSQNPSYSSSSDSSGGDNSWNPNPPPVTYYCQEAVDREYDF